MLANLLGQLRRGGDGDTVDVLADALLEASDPRGEVIAQTRANLDASAAIAKCVDRVRDKVPEALSLHLDHGFVTRLEVPDVRKIDPSVFEDEPLAALVVEIPSENSIDALVGFIDVAERAAGIEFSNSVDDQRWSAVTEFIEATEPRFLTLSMYTSEARLTTAWPFLEALAIEGSVEQVAHVLAQTSKLRRLELRVLRGDDTDAAIDAALAIDSLEHIDVRGIKLSPRAKAELDAFSGTVVGAHAKLPASSPLADPFAPGTRWQRQPPVVRRVAAFASGLNFAAVHDFELRLHENDTPTFRGDVDMCVSAIAPFGDDLVLGSADGDVVVWSPRTRSVTERLAKLNGVVRTLSAHDGIVAASCDGGFWVSENGTERTGAAQPNGIVAFANGVARTVGTTVVIERPSGRSRTIELRDPVLALAAHNEKLLAITARHVWRLDRSPPKCLGTRDLDAPPALSVGSDCSTWAISKTACAVRRRRKTVTSHYSSYSGGHAPLLVADVAAIDGEAAIVAFEHGGMNILLPEGRALKVDPFPGDPHLSWVFVYDGSILMAD